MIKSLALFGVLLTAACPAHQTVKPTSKPQRPAAEAMVVGTIHKHHLLQPGYPLQLLGAVLARYAPDLVLVEIRPGPFGKRHFEDGPFEMAYVTELARRRGITVVPIDWWREAAQGARAPRPVPEDRAAYRAVLGKLMTRYRFPPTFAEAHAAERTRLIGEALSLRARYLGGDAAWHQRQAWFHQRATEAVSRHRPRRVLAFVGNQHRPELEQHLRGLGLALRSPLTLDLEADDALRARPAPEAVVARWREGVARLTKRAAAARRRAGGPALAGKLESKARYFGAAVERRGRCCLEDKAQLAPAAKPLDLPPAKDLTALGIDQQALQRLLERAKASATDALVVVKDGKLVGKWTFGKPEGPIELMSVTKSIVSLAVGRLIDLGAIPSLDQPVHAYYPEWRQGKKRAVTLRHLLNHTSGLQSHRTTGAEIYPAPDLVKLALTAELSDTPGTRFFYNNKAVNLLAGIVDKAAGERLDDFTARELFAPLGIRDFTWMRDKAGNPHVLAGLAMRADDLARVGQLLLDGGKHAGRQLLSAEWIARSTSKPGQKLMPSCGLLWWIHHAWRKSTVDHALLERWRKAGASPRVLRAARSLRGQQLEHKVFIGRLIRALGGKAAAKRLFGPLEVKGVQPSTVITGPVVGFGGNGWLGQYLAVLPKHRLVAVRQRRAPADAGKKTFNQKKIDTMRDFSKLVRALVSAKR